MGLFCLHEGENNVQNYGSIIRCYEDGLNMNLIKI